MFVAISRPLDVWDAGMRGESPTSSMLEFDREMSSPRHSQEEGRSSGALDGTASQSGSSEGSHQTASQEPVAKRPSPFKHGSMADAYQISKEERPFPVTKPGRPRAKSLWVRQALAGAPVYESFGQQTASEVIPRPSAMSLGDETPADLPECRDMPPPDMADSHYWSKFTEWSRHGHASKLPLQQSRRSSFTSQSDSMHRSQCSEEQSQLLSPPPTTTKKHNSPYGSLIESDPAATSIAGDSFFLPAQPSQRIPTDMSSMDPALMQHLREAHARAMDPAGGYSAATAGDTRWSEMTYSRMPRLMYPDRVPRGRSGVVDAEGDGEGLGEYDEEVEGSGWLVESNESDEGREEGV